MTDTRGRFGRGGRFLWQDRIVLACCAALLAGFMMPPARLAPPLPELEALDPQLRKTVFFGYLDPIVERVNGNVLRQRLRLAEIMARRGRGDRLTWQDRRLLKRLAERYEVELGEDLDEGLASLWQRVDVVPRSLVLVQAAKESGWGTSRFATEGNNLFGQRCYSDGCGLTPEQARRAGFSVAAYESVLESVREYVRNLNTHRTYREFRRLRKDLREGNEALSGLRLADGLLDYSERGEAYVAEIKAMIRQNALESSETS